MLYYLPGLYLSAAVTASQRVGLGGAKQCFREGRKLQALREEGGEVLVVVMHPKIPTPPKKLHF